MLSVCQRGYESAAVSGKSSSFQRLPQRARIERATDESPSLKYFSRELKRLKTACELRGHHPTDAVCQLFEDLERYHRQWRRDFGSWVETLPANKQTEIIGYLLYNMGCLAQKAARHSGSS